MKNILLGIIFTGVTALAMPNSPSTVWMEENVYGVWKLTSFEIKNQAGQSEEWCEGAEGTLQYTDRELQYMSVAINCSSNPEKMVHYSGTFWVESDVGPSMSEYQVHHNVRNANNPAWIGNSLSRWLVKPNVDQIELVGPFGEDKTATVSWERMTFFNLF